MKEIGNNMYNRAFYTLQVKKAVWYVAMGSLAYFTLVSTPLAPLTIVGIAAGISLPHLMPFMPTVLGGMIILLSPLLASLTSIAVPFNLGFFGIIAHRIMTGGKMVEALKKTHIMGDAEKTDLETIKKLENKTNIKIDVKKICEVDAKKFSPNAAASGGYENSIYIFSNILKAPFTRKEKKAVFAHEFGHIKHHDSLAHSVTSFLFWTTAAVSLFSFSFPLALLAVIGSKYCYYAISQIDELLADQFAAQHANPRALISSFDKLKAAAKPIRQRERRERTLLQWPKAILHSVDRAVGMTSHPTVKVRKSYLEAYAAEKATAKGIRLAR